MDKKRNRIILVSVLTPVALLALGLTYLIFYMVDDYQQVQAWSRSGINKLGQAVYTDRPLEDNQLITERDIYEKQIPSIKILADSILCKNDVIGKRVKYPMIQNQLMTCEDIGMSREELHKDELVRLKRCDGNDLKALCPHLANTKVRLAEKSVYKLVQDMQEGAILKVSDFKLESREGEETEHCVSDIRLLVGRKTKYGMTKGQPVHSFDLEMESTEEQDAYVSTRDLKPGESLKKDDIEKKHFNENQRPVTAILDPALILGSKVMQPVAKDQVLRSVDLEALPL